MTDRFLGVCRFLLFPPLVLPPVLLHSSGVSDSRNCPGAPYVRHELLQTSYVGRTVNTTTVSEVVEVVAGWKVIGELRYGCYFTPRILLFLESCVDLTVYPFGSFGYRLSKCHCTLADHRGVHEMCGTVSQIVLRLPS